MQTAPREESLRGKRAAVVVFSDFSTDPRARRSAAALEDPGMQVDVTQGQTALWTPSWGQHAIHIGNPSSIEAMAADRLCALRAVRPAGPYLLGGHCDGALVALAMARQLVREGDEVRLVVLLEVIAPPRSVQILSGVSVAVDRFRRVPTERRGRRLHRCRMRAEEARARLRYYRGRLSIFAQTDLVERSVILGRMVGSVRAALHRRAQGDGRRGQGIPPPSQDIDTRFRRAVEAYVPARYPGRLGVLRGENTPDPRPDFGWSLVSRRVAGVPGPGEHATSVTPHLEATADRLRACLEVESGR